MDTTNKLLADMLAAGGVKPTPTLLNNLRPQVENAYLEGLLNGQFDINQPALQPAFQPVNVNIMSPARMNQLSSISNDNDEDEEESGL